MDIAGVIGTEAGLKGDSEVEAFDNPGVRGIDAISSCRLAKFIAEFRLTRPILLKTPSGR